MAIKITYRGTPPAKKVYGVTCGSCCSKLEFNIGDVRTNIDQRQTSHYIQCPVCLKGIYMDKLYEAK